MRLINEILFLPLPVGGILRMREGVK